MSLLGLPLEMALERLSRQGITPTVVYTKAPRHPVEAGQARVLRYDLTNQKLWVALFPQGPQQQGEPWDSSEKK